MEQSITSLMKMGWYLDTSLFMDFVERNIRKGFDNAEPHDGRTLMHVRGSSKQTQVFVPVISNNKRFAFELTRTINHLRIIQLSNGLMFYYSELVKAEAVRALRKAHSHRESSEIINWWQAFCFLLNKYQKIEAQFPIDKRLSDLALNFPIRKNVQDYIHLILAKEKGLAFVTSDKLDNQIEDLQRDFYKHIYFWPDVKDSIPVDDVYKEMII